MSTVDGPVIVFPFPPLTESCVRLQIRLQSANSRSLNKAREGHRSLYLRVGGFLMDAARRETDSTMSFRTVNTPRPPARDGQLSIEADNKRERGEIPKKQQGLNTNCSDRSRPHRPNSLTSPSVRSDPDPIQTFATSSPMRPISLPEPTAPQFQQQQLHSTARREPPSAVQRIVTCSTSAAAQHFLGAKPSTPGQTFDARDTRRTVGRSRPLARGISDMLL